MSCHSVKRLLMSSENGCHTTLSDIYNDSLYIILLMMSKLYNHHYFLQANIVSLFLMSEWSSTVFFSCNIWRIIFLVERYKCNAWQYHHQTSTVLMVKNESHSELNLHSLSLFYWLLCSHILKFLPAFVQLTFSCHYYVIW